MRRRHRILTIGLMTMIAGMPLATFAQTGSGTTTAPAPGTTTPPPASPGISPPPGASSPSLAPGASPALPGTPGTQRGGRPSEVPSEMASPRTPMIQADCTKGRWHQFGFPDEAACVNALPARPPSTR